MEKILKIVGGPLKGAEIALVAGTRVKVGSGDGCDILVADPTLEKAAFELDVAEDEVTIVTPDGAAKTMLDFEAREFGSSAFAIGPAEGAWQEIVWPRAAKDEEAGDQKDGADEGAPSEAQPAVDPQKDAGKDAAPEAKDEEKPSRVSRLLCFVLLAVAAVLLLLALFWYLRRCRDGREGLCEVVAPRVTLADVAARYGLTVTETNGETLVRGDLKTRAERLSATAAAFQAKPGAEVDIVDDESLFESAEALLGMVAQGLPLKVAAATNRVVALKGSVGSADVLRGVLAALAADVAGLAKVDCTGVSVPSGEPLGEDLALPVPAAVAKAASAPLVAAVPAAAKQDLPKLPVCGIVMTPYPCLILKSGVRVTEGGEFGGYTVRRISADSLTLTDGSRTLEWKP